jgi:hypothetical protein
LAFWLALLYSKSGAEFPLTEGEIFDPLIREFRCRVPETGIKSSHSVGIYTVFRMPIGLKNAYFAISGMWVLDVCGMRGSPQSTWHSATI